MAVAFVKQAIASSSAGTTTITCTLGSAPASGNLLVFAMGGDKNTGALTFSGFTQAFSLLSTSVSLYVWWKVSDGTETAVSPTWATSSSAGNMAWYAEYQDAAVTGTTWEVVGSASNITSESNVLTTATGTTGTLTAAGFGLAFGAVDSSTSMATVSAWGNSYAIRYTASGGTGRGSIAVAEKDEPSLVTTNSTFTFTGTADQASAAIVVFRKVPSVTAWPFELLTPTPRYR